MTKKSFMPFKISHIDPLGQGVSKLQDKILFIPKTAVGDSGIAELISEKKGVLFGRVKTLECSSSQRIDPICPHFGSCYSCHFLHIPYDLEISCKKESYRHIFRNIALPPVEVLTSDHRLNYRNRIQLHYSIKKKLLGFLDPHSHEIIPVPECSISLQEIQIELKKLYQNHHWMNLAPVDSPEGHLEIYFKDDKIHLSWNKTYADGGFSQVNELQNFRMKELLALELNQSNIVDVLDLFAGDGNLTQSLDYKKRLCVDLYSGTNQENAEFLCQNLYSANALRRLQSEIEKRKLHLTHLILDPPRSGFRDLNLWLKILKPKNVVYISCNPHTLARDLSTLKDYSFTKSVLLDFFPSTFHFETMVFLKMN